MKSRPATPHEIARFGHIAAALRAVMKQRGWGMAELSEALGKPRSDTSAFKWIKGTGAPALENRVKLAKLTGIPEADLMPRAPGAATPATTTSPGTLVPRAVKVPAVKAQGDVLSFVVNSDGHARIRLDAVLPLETATPLLRMLLDAGVVFGQETTT